MFRSSGHLLVLVWVFRAVLSDGVVGVIAMVVVRWAMELDCPLYVWKFILNNGRGLKWYFICLLLIAIIMFGRWHVISHFVKL